MSIKRVDSFLFPKDCNNLHFGSSHYTWVVENRHIFYRRWLVYSIFLDIIIFFCCKLFKNEETLSRMGNLGNDGYKYWRNMTRSFKNHEASRDHGLHVFLS